MVIYPADRVMDIKDSKKLGITAAITHIDFKSIISRARDMAQDGSQSIRKSIEQAARTMPFGFYEGEGRFVDDYVIEVNGERIRGEKIFIASGTRPMIPPIPGLDGIDYLTNENLWNLERAPESLVIIGGSYIGVEFAHFFAAMGTKVTIIEMLDRLVASEEREISDLLKRELSKRMEVLTGFEVVSVRKMDVGVEVKTKDRNMGQEKVHAAEMILVAAGRISNADILNASGIGMELDERGFIKTNDYLETNVENIWAMGDVNGRMMFRHSANRETEIVMHNLVHEQKAAMDYTAVPHAVFTHPQIAGVGLTEDSARAQGYEVSTSTTPYDDVAMGKAMVEHDTFAKAVFKKGTNELLGFHIIGPYSSVLVQEVVDAIQSGAGLNFIAAGIHIHPALSELVKDALLGQVS